ncbi:MAG: HPF/RaiA family ribosome-associated protein [Actinomycetota bacterium]|nr:HPF/RaiA family ribosome-associated protein [Actinomycetota bacterium]
MIKLEIDVEDYDLSDELKARIQDRIGGLDEFMDTLDKGHVTVAWEGGKNEQTRVSAQVWGGGDKFEGSDVDWKSVTAIDKTRSKLESQITKVHGKRLSERDRRRR